MSQHTVTFYKNNFDIDKYPVISQATQINKKPKVKLSFSDFPVPLTRLFSVSHNVRKFFSLLNEPSWKSNSHHSRWAPKCEDAADGNSMWLMLTIADKQHKLCSANWFVSAKSFSRKLEKSVRRKIIVYLQNHCANWTNRWTHVKKAFCW